MSPFAAPVVVIDYGAGNLASLAGALEREGVPAVTCADAATLPPEGPIVLPGVGHFRAAKEALLARGLWRGLEDALAAGRAVVGICLGLQLLSEGSEEAPGERGLAAIRGTCTRLPPTVKVPHMGFAETSALALPAYVPPPPRYFYYVHSYALPVTDETALVAIHGAPFAAASARGKVIGFQGHPERSGREGQRFLGALLRGMAGGGS